MPEGTVGALARLGHVHHCRAEDSLHLWKATDFTTNLEPSDRFVNRDSVVPRIAPAMIRGSIGFGIVSLAAFSVWAFAGRWFQNHLGEAGLYATCALVFVALSGVTLHRLAGNGPGSALRFYGIFIPAFLAYAIAWCLTWFMLRFGRGEWLASLLGSVAFVAIMSWRLRNAHRFLQTSLIVFALHSAGYFLGGQMMHWLLSPNGSTIAVLAKLSWGLLYGLGFGAGIGYAFHAVQSNSGSTA